MGLKRWSANGASSAPRSQNASRIESAHGSTAVNRQRCFRDLVASQCAAFGYSEGLWSIQAELDGRLGWLRACHERARTPAQGWKLHLSATVLSAEEVLFRTLPILLAEEIAFKLAANHETVEYLNGGLGGLSQVGKIVTIYPNDDAMAVRLALALDEATRGLPGPVIGSDRALAPGSLVHYRYGGFTSLTVSTRLGELVPAIVAPDGQLEPDLRPLTYRQPAWVVDPFVVDGVCSPLEPPDPILGERYLHVSTFHRAVSGDVVLAVDIVAGRQVIVKQGRRHGMVGHDGVDARERLRHEAEVLHRIAPDARFPLPLAQFEQGGDAYLVMESVEGEPLDQHIAERFQEGRPPSTRQIVAWGEALADILAALHAHGYIYGDLKAGNLIVTPDGGLCLIDFNSIDGPSARLRATGLATRGYASPQQRPGRSACVADDIYGLGGLLFFLTTGADPAQAPYPFALLGRPLALLNPMSGPGLAAVLARCLECDPSRRFATMADVTAALGAVADEQPAAAQFGGERTNEADEVAKVRVNTWLGDLGTTLLVVAERWRCGDFATGFAGFPGKVAASDGGLFGAAGVVLVLAEMAVESGDAAICAGLAASARRLAEAPLSTGEAPGGLYTGEAGVGAALLRAGQALGEGELIEAALERGRSIAVRSHRSPDMMSGMAGRMRFHLMLFDELDDPGQLQAAVAVGEALLAAAEATASGVYRWKIPDGYGQLSVTAPLGYGRGAAGIGDALLDLFESTGEERFFTTARQVGAWLSRLAQPVLEDDSGLNWPEQEHQPLVGASWYCGAGGIARFFLHLAMMDALPGAGEIATRAVRTAARGARMAGPTQCYGLAGNIEVLLDAYQASNDPCFLSEAWDLVRLLGAFRIERCGVAAWPGEWPEHFEPGFLTGNAGVAACLLRLVDPTRRPHLLSRAGFRYFPHAKAPVC